MNIENKSELLNYLHVKHGIDTMDSDQFTILRGGVSNRTILYEGKEQSLVIKQALRKLRTKSSWYSDPERLRVEANALDWFNTFLPENTVPKRFFLDEDNFILGMEAVAQPHENLKELLLKRSPAEDLITQMGELLGIIHSVGIEDTHAKILFSERSYFRSLRIEAYYEHTAAAQPMVKTFYDDLISNTFNHCHTIVHGDYSPKNILVKNEKLVLLDHEVMHFGDPAFDVGFALTHLLSKANHFSDRVYIKYAAVFWSSYTLKFLFPDPKFEERCVKHTLACMLARIHGRSPLEYLTEDHRLRQSEITIKLIKKKPETLPQLFEQLKENLEDYQT